MASLVQLSIPPKNQKLIPFPVLHPAFKTMGIVHVSLCGILYYQYFHVSCRSNLSELGGGFT